MLADRHIVIGDALYNVMNYRAPRAGFIEKMLFVLFRRAPRMSYSFVRVDDQGPLVEYDTPLNMEFCPGLKGPCRYRRSFEQFKGFARDRVFNAHIPAEFDYLSFEWLRDHHFGNTENRGFLQSISHAEDIGVILSYTSAVGKAMARKCLLCDESRNVEDITIEHDNEGWPLRVYLNENNVIAVSGGYYGEDIHVYIWPIEQLGKRSLDLSNLRHSFPVNDYGDQVVTITGSGIGIINCEDRCISYLDTESAQCVDMTRLEVRSFRGYDLLTR